MLRTFSTFLCLSISYAINVSLTKQCECKVFTNETTCENNEKCIWTQTQCEERTCEQFFTEKKCNQQSRCSWNKSKCSNFTKCSDYYVNDSYNCYIIGDDTLNQWCQPVENGNICVPYKYNQCGIIEEDCSGFKDYWNMCYWNSNNNECLEVDIRICSNLVNEYLCNLFGIDLGCKWNNLSCTPLVCEDFMTEADCVIARQDNINQDPFLCKWNINTNSCVQAEDVSHLDFSNCYTNTLNNYLWDSTINKCVQCASIKTNP